jgi:hypothetical protein
MNQFPSFFLKLLNFGVALANFGILPPHLSSQMHIIENTLPKARLTL